MFWYYNWGCTPLSVATIPFVPLVFRSSTSCPLVGQDFVLGFNEPDNDSQANMTTLSAISKWSKVAGVVSSSGKVGSPATAGNPAYTTSWQYGFMSGNPQPVDFIAVHWYKGADTSKFADDITRIHSLHNLPIWITEFAPQTASNGNNYPKFTQTVVNQFIFQSVSWMNSVSFVQRFAWHDAKVRQGYNPSTSALFDINGALTCSGQYYAYALSIASTCVPLNPFSTPMPACSTCPQYRCPQLAIVEFRGNGCCWTYNRDGRKKLHAECSVCARSGCRTQHLVRPM